MADEKIQLPIFDVNVGYRSAPGSSLRTVTIRVYADSYSAAIAAAMQEEDIRKAYILEENRVQHLTGPGPWEPRYTRLIDKTGCNPTPTKSFQQLETERRHAYL